MSKSTRKEKLRVLRDRLLFIEHKIQGKEYSEKAISFMKQEADALKWAIEVLEALIELKRNV